MPHYHLTNAAAADLTSIVEYTLEEWGEEQVVTYRNRLDSRLKLLAKFPEVGRSHINLSEHVLYVVEGKHYVFYHIVEDGIEVLRFLHGRTDILRHISEHL